MNKKLIGLVLFLSLAVGLGACNQETPADGEVSPGAAPTESPSPAAT
ncbi:MAG: hypothetical protein AB1589_02165 [Cyanobacteriota bacterium]